MYINNNAYTLNVLPVKKTIVFDSQTYTENEMFAALCFIRQLYEDDKISEKKYKKIEKKCSKYIDIGELVCYNKNRK